MMRSALAFLALLAAAPAFAEPDRRCNVQIARAPDDVRARSSTGSPPSRDARAPRGPRHRVRRACTCSRATAAGSRGSGSFPTPRASVRSSRAGSPTTRSTACGCPRRSCRAGPADDAGGPTDPTARRGRSAIPTMRMLFRSQAPVGRPRERCGRTRRARARRLLPPPGEGDLRPDHRALSDGAVAGGHPRARGSRRELRAPRERVPRDQRCVRRDRDRVVPRRPLPRRALDGRAEHAGPQCGRGRGGRKLLTGVNVRG